MDETNRAMIIVFLLCVAAVGNLAEGQTLDVCASCHAEATCDDKVDGSGKVCNCKYGFVGNGRTFCQDKDECQIGAHRICGQHTNCHNTYGSYDCTCLSGFSPTNNKSTFIPNDGTSCQDIDECRIPGLCGDGATCRNIEGSFDCSCQMGYQVHNGPEPFNPHKNKASCIMDTRGCYQTPAITHPETEIHSVVDCGQPASVKDMVLLQPVSQTTYGSVTKYGCAEGFVWRSGDNNSVCGADRMWKGPTAICEDVDCGSPPDLPNSHIMWNKSSRLGTMVLYQCKSGFHNVGKGSFSICTADGEWERPSVLCQETLCGIPPILESTEQVWDSNESPGSSVLYLCKEGFYNKGGHNVSVCSESGQWTHPTLSCQEILCGDPPLLHHTAQVWNGSVTPGSTVTYFCKRGFYHHEGNNVSVCTSKGHWTKPTITCKDVDCGVPPTFPDSALQWDHTSKVDSQVVYQCNFGYHNVGEGNLLVCTESGKWDGASLDCQEINCGKPVLKPHAEVFWDGASNLGSVVVYQCEEGYYTRSLRNYSRCQENGLWEDIGLQCEEISCGPPLKLPHTNLLWNGTSKTGSVVPYECMGGFYQASGNNNSSCLLSGEWEKVSIKCKVKCGPLPVLANSEVVWQNRSLVIHRCVDGYHSWRGSNVSVCSSSGVWEEAPMKCVEIKPPINHLLVMNEKCLHWKAEKYEDDTEVYKVTYEGSRDYQRSFHDIRSEFLTSKADQLEICLNLLPVTNYSIVIHAQFARFTTAIVINTSVPVPPAPRVYYQEFETPVPTLRLRRSHDTLEAISSYQVFVLPLEGIMIFDCSSPASLQPSSKLKSCTEYITAQIDVRHVRTEMNFTVGDGLHYGGYFNAPLENSRNYYIVVRAVSQWKTVFKSTCVLWAKVRGISFVLKVSSLSTASVGLIFLIILGGYIFIWFFKKT